MKERYRLRDIAELTGCSVSTVSRVLNDHPDVRPELRAAVWAAIQELGYQPDPGARSLRSGSSKAIGFLVRDLTNQTFAEFAMGMQDLLHTRGYTLILHCSLATGGSDAEGLISLLARRVDGLIVSSREEGNPETESVLRRAGVPIVFLDRETAAPYASAVRADHASGVSDATRALLEAGHTRIAIVAGAANLWPTRSRVAGFRAAHEAFGQEVSERLVELADYTVEHGRDATARLLGAKEPVTAIVASGSRILIGVLDEVFRRGLRIPEDLSVIACDAPDFLDAVRPSLSTVERDEREMGAVAAKSVLQAIRSPDKRTGGIMMKTEFIDRESLGAPSS